MNCFRQASLALAAVSLWGCAAPSDRAEASLESRSVTPYIVQACIPSTFRPDALSIARLTLDASGWAYNSADWPLRKHTGAGQPVYEVSVAALEVLKVHVATLDANDFVFGPPALLPDHGWTAWQAPMMTERHDLPEQEKYFYRREHHLPAIPHPPRPVYPLLRYRRTLAGGASGDNEAGDTAAIIPGC